MKKAVFILSVMFFLIPYCSYASKFYIDGMGNYGNYADASKMVGYGGGFGFELIQDIDVYLRYFHAFDKKTRDGKTVEEYKEDTFAACVDYKYQLSKYPLYWTTSIGVGPGRVQIRNNDWAPDDERKETGVFIGFWTGLRYTISQHFGVFGLIGYQKTVGFKSDLSDAKVGGYQFAVGVTATIFGNNSGIDKGY